MCSFMCSAMILCPLFKSNEEFSYSTGCFDHKVNQKEICPMLCASKALNMKFSRAEDYFLPKYK